MSTPARSAASASSSVITRSMVSCRLPFIARRSATVGRLRAPVLAMRYTWIMTFPPSTRTG